MFATAVAAFNFAAAAYCGWEIPPWWGEPAPGGCPLGPALLAPGRGLLLAVVGGAGPFTLTPMLLPGGGGGESNM